MALVNDNLKYLRTNLLGMTQVQFAKTVGSDIKNVYGHETNVEFKRSRVALFEYCDYYNKQERITSELGKITPDRLLEEDLKKTHSEYLAKSESFGSIPLKDDHPPASAMHTTESELAWLSPGLRAFLSDPETKYRMNPTRDEVEMLKGITFLEPESPGSFYAQALYKSRMFRDTLAQKKTKTTDKRNRKPEIA